MADFSIESTYGLSPLQHGMLFHRLYAPRAGVDIEQIVDALHEELRVSHFRRSWQRAVDHHPALRTTFKWRGLSEPVQQVHRAITVPFEEHDWRGLSTDRQVSRLEEYLDADRHQGFELDKGPLLRLAVFRLAKADYRFVWTFPHAVLDGRSFPMVLEDVFGIYEALGRDVDLQLAARRPYRDYIESLNSMTLPERSRSGEPRSMDSQRPPLWRSTRRERLTRPKAITGSERSAFRVS
jgi:NRPS condensation-like uncharacterized protein